MNWEDLNFNKSYNGMAAYAQSKLSNILHAKELAERLKDTNISTYALHPGKIDDLFLYLPCAQIKSLHFPFS